MVNFLTVLFTVNCNNDEKMAGSGPFKEDNVHVTQQGQDWS